MMKYKAGTIGWGVMDGGLTELFELMVGGLMSGEVFTADDWTTHIPLFQTPYISLMYIHNFVHLKWWVFPPTQFPCLDALSLSSTHLREHVLYLYFNAVNTSCIVSIKYDKWHLNRRMHKLQEKYERHFLMKHLHNVLNNCAVLLIWIKCFLFWWHTYSICAALTSCSSL